MKTYDKLIQITDSQEIAEGVDLPKIYLHKWLVLGQTEHVCRYGTLSDGFEKITDSQKYSQAIKEYYYIALAIRREKAMAMEAQARIYDAEEDLNAAVTKADKLRAQAKYDLACLDLDTCLVNVEDRKRMLSVYIQEISYLKPIVEAKYPKGIEQAEKDNWQAVAEYRMIKASVPGAGFQQLDSIPLHPVDKAKLGVHYGRMDAIAPVMLTNKEKLKELDTVEEDKRLPHFVASLEHKEAN